MQTEFLKFIFVVYCALLHRYIPHNLVLLNPLSPIACYSVDFHLDVLMQPQPLHPIPAGFSVGILAPYFSSFAIFTALIIFMCIQYVLLILCFLRKYLAFLRMKRGEASKKAASILLIVFCSVAVAIVIFMLHGILSPEEMSSLIIREYPSYEQGFHSLPKGYAIYDANFYWFGTLVFIAIGLGLGFSVIICTTYRMFSILEELSRIASSTNVRKQRIALLSLVAQLIASSVACCPMILMAVLLLIEYEYTQIFTRYCLVMFSAHASINVVVIILTTPSFRRFTFFRSERKSTSVAVSVQ